MMMPPFRELKNMQDLASRTSRNDRVLIDFTGDGQTQFFSSGTE